MSAGGGEDVKDYLVRLIPPSGDGWLAYSERYADLWIPWRPGMRRVRIAAASMPQAKRRAMSMAKRGLRMEDAHT